MGGKKDKMGVDVVEQPTIRNSATNCERETANKPINTQKTEHKQIHKRELFSSLSSALYFVFFLLIFVREKRNMNASIEK